MNFINSIKKEIKNIPYPIRIFLIKAFLLFIIWQIVYTTILLPDRLIDKPLSAYTGKATAFVLNKIYGVNNVRTEELLYSEQIDGVAFSYLKTVLFWGNKRLIGIADSCNGLSLYVLFLGFILIYPSKLKLKILFGIMGLIIIVATNIARSVGLVYLSLEHPSYLPFAHHYLYKIITYAVVFGLWVWFIKMQKNKN